MARAHISPWRRMRRSRAPSNGLGRFFAAQFSAGCTTNMPGFDFRQAQGQFFAEDSDIGNLSHEETRRLSTAGFVSSRGMSYENRDWSKDSRQRVTKKSSPQHSP